MSKISIITPVYNSEKYLHQCIESIVNQTLEDIEIILIDDGSTDSSGEICEEYTKKDKRIKVIHNKNLGLGISYNLGIDTASGEYIGFIESDDYVQNNMFEELFSISLENNKPDIVKSAWYDVYEKDNQIIKDSQMLEFDSGIKFNIKEHPNLLTKQATVWSAVYRTDFLKNNNIRYLQTPGASYQDVSFSYKVFTLSESIVVTSNAYLYYRKDNEASSINSNEKSEVIFNEYEEVDRFFNQNPDIKKWANEYKLIKQYYDYNWNYNRVAIQLKHDFIKHFAQDFKNYRDRGELTDKFYAKINGDFLNNIMNLV